MYWDRQMNALKKVKHCMTNFKRLHKFVEKHKCIIVDRIENTNRLHYSDTMS